MTSIYFIEKGMWGGIYYVPKRHSKANNKYMQSFGVNKPSIAYVLRIWIKTTYMVGQWANICPTVDLNG